MSLSMKQKQNTTHEFKQNLAISQLDLATIAQALNATERKIKNIMELKGNSLEDPWIIRNYLIDYIESVGKKTVPFSALNGDYHRHCFLDSRKIEQKKLS